MSIRKLQVLAGLAIGALTCVLLWHFKDQRTQDQKIRALQRTVESLQASLKVKEDELKRIPSQSRDRGNGQSAADGRVERKSSEQATPATHTSSYQTLKELEADSTNDPRSYVDK